MQGRNWGEIRDGEAVREEYQAGVLSQRLIIGDLSEMKDEKWTNETIPDEIPARLGGELVWLPTGKKGALLAVGGTALSLSESASFPVTDKNNETRTKGEGFMKDVHVYDIDQKQWYTQTTTGDIPPPTAEFCTVVASSQDGSSHQVIPIPF